MEIVNALLKVTFLHGCSSRYLNCTNGSEARKRLNQWNATVILNARILGNGNQTKIIAK